MQFQKYAAPYPINQVLAYYWTLHNQEAPTAYRFVPDAHLEWIFQLGQPWSYRFADGPIQKGTKAFLMGQFKRYMDLYLPKDDFRLFGVKFYPWAAQWLLGINMSEATELNIALADLPNPALRQLANDVLAQQEVEEMMTLINRFLLDQLGYYSPGDLAPIMSQLDFPFPKIRKGTYPFGQRRLEQKFQFQVGISPKRFQRILRINQIIQQLLKAPSVRLTDMAYQFQLTDQSHFIREFKQFTGYAPKAFLRNSQPDGDIFNLRI